MSALRIRILLVDDHPMVREGLRSRLGSVAHLEVVGEAGEPQQALACLSACAPSVVLMDVGLKAVGAIQNGIELTQAMLAREPGLRVLMFSMYDNPEYVQRALQAGARGYVLKDAPASEIVAAIAAVAAGGTFLSEALSRRLFRNQQPRPMLSPRESEILSALARGESSKQIAKALDLSVRTVETHRQSIKRKLGLEGQAELIKYAVEHARTF
ncbi:DNA-binding NarL/FixJ family response regulator [Paucibacter oligotrophus]|uniref:DNA-binding NarL/FixJ family response regulator n=1 Tax=Roseateles oligotrophus TaxID=1769250 RepID=A0A840L720_9BURK|nr:response regulator transcription factor [Roseateles oligotrophus]MBB4842445.1 DNA-binding NarL/FixJ family response regulator [Roseateles oligotrophus]